METTQQSTVEFAQLVSRGCGLDVHKEVLVATIRGEGLTLQTRSFGAFTQDIEELANWLRTHQVTHVAMESTGVYWKPVSNVLGEEFEIVLVNARHIKHVPGHKTDKKDSEWLVKLLLAGWLKASFVPPQQVRSGGIYSAISAKRLVTFPLNGTEFKRCSKMPILKLARC